MRGVFIALMFLGGMLGAGVETVRAINSTNGNFELIFHFLEWVSYLNVSLGQFTVVETFIINVFLFKRQFREVSYIVNLHAYLWKHSSVLMGI